MATISASVGKNGVNKHDDVVTVQQLLNGWLGAAGKTLLDPDGDCGDKTIKAITGYQAEVLHRASPDGKVDPGGGTLAALSAGTGMGGVAPSPAPPVPAAPPPPAASAASLLSGGVWWHANQANYPNSSGVDALVSPFREQVQAFIAAMKAGGATVTVSATRRNPTRAHLMHFCWKVAKGLVGPAQVPAVAGCAITWDHGNLTKSKKGAQEMVDLFGIAFQPSLTSLHIQGRAIDMTISWSGMIKVKDKAGTEHVLGAPRNGGNTKLHAIGASYGVKKLVSDPPHWSDNGH